MFSNLVNVNMNDYGEFVDFVKSLLPYDLIHDIADKADYTASF